MPKTVIRATNLSKRFLLEHQDKRAFSVTATEGLRQAILGQKGRGAKEFWALDDISFDIQQGEIVSLVGDNGSGKSTLLKIIAHVMEATRGTVKVRGRMRALLEVGTGFHYELSGRENIFFNSALLGVGRAETRKHLDEIIAFSGVGEYIDIPMKYYSSGMRVRLGFAVATQFRPEILILDEVLTVGDYGFRRKSLARIRSMTEQYGTTTLFVSHNLHAVQSLCDKAIWLHKGKLLKFGDIHEVLDDYKSNLPEQTNLLLHTQTAPSFFSGNTSSDTPAKPPTSMQLHQVWVKNPTGGEGRKIHLKQPIEIGVEFSTLNTDDRIDITLQFLDETEEVFMVSSTAFEEGMKPHFLSGRFIVTFELPPYFLNSGMVHIDVLAHLNKEKIAIFRQDKALSFHATPDDVEFGVPHRKPRGAVRPKFPWNSRRIL